MAGPNGRERPLVDLSSPGASHPASLGVNGMAKARSSEPSVSETIPSDFAAGFEVQRRIIEAVERHGYDTEEIFALKIATEEALVNAIKHGNKLDKNKHVRIEALVTPDKIQIEIEDEGEGFDRSLVPNPLDEENIEKPSGRGILLIESYMTEVAWSAGGRCVRMTKRREPAA